MAPPPLSSQDTAQGPVAVRVLPDVAAITREFDYAVPDAWRRDGRALRLAVGSMVRVELSGRRVGGWVTQLDPDVAAEVTLRPLAKFSGVGPPSDVVDICRWAAHRWVGATSALLGTASPPQMVPTLSRSRPSRPQDMPDQALVGDAFAAAGSVVRVPPHGDRRPFVLGAVARGNALVLVPAQSQATTLVGRLRQRGIAAGLYPRDWAMGTAGATMVGSRAAALAPVAGLSSVLVIDEHDEVYQEERAPTWHARDIVIERARRAGVPCVLVSPMPTAEARHVLPLLSVDRSAERAGWPRVQVVDPRTDDAARGTLWTTSVVRALQRDGPVACVVNRKGRSRLMSCANCDELVLCDQCGSAMRQNEGGELVCANLGHTRPLLCLHCAGTKIKNLRIGVSRAREELEALLREPVVEVTGDTDDSQLTKARVLVGTEAVLHRASHLETVVFADFDQELVAPRYRAGEQALAMIVRAGRLVGARGAAGTPGEVVVQTRQPTHPVLTAATSADVETWARGETARREMLGYPPFAALAEISGAGAEAFIEALGQPLGIGVQGPVDGKWLVRSPTSQALSDALLATPRPKGRLRISVDPLRL